MDLSGKVASVTGSGRGLGPAYAQELARAGAAVVVDDVDEAVASAMTRAVPFVAPCIEARENGEQLPPFARQEMGSGTPEVADFAELETRDEVRPLVMEDNAVRALKLA